MGRGLFQLCIVVPRHVVLEYINGRFPFSLSPLALRPEHLSPLKGPPCLVKLNS